MLDELKEILDSAEFEDAGFITIARLTREGPRAEMLLDLQAQSDAFERQAWLISCETVRATRLGSDPVYGVQWLDDHIVLAPYVDTWVQLGFSGRVSDAKHVIADLWEAHRRLARDWFRFDEFLNHNLPLVELLGTGAGVLADGPSRLVNAYAEVVRAHGTEPYTISERAPQRWTDHTWETERDDLRLLWLEPTDFVIGSGFAAQRVSVDLVPPSRRTDR